MYTIAIAITSTFIGCGKNPNIGYVSYGDTICECIDDCNSVKLIINDYNPHECIYENEKVARIVKKSPPKYKKVAKTTKSGCETTITEIFKSKHTGKKPLIICRGKLLEKNQKTKTIYVNK